MRSVFLASSTIFLLAGGLAFADPHGGPGGPGGGSSTTTTLTSIPVVGNAGAADGSSAATTGATSVNANDNTLTSNSNNSLDVTKTLVSVGSVSLSDTKTDTHMNVTFATSGNTGSVSKLTFSGGGSGMQGEDGHHGSSGGALVASGDASMSYANNGVSGINTVEQNTGIGSLQQNSVALGSYVGGGSTGFNGF
ncbi:MAG: hypothetical protein KGQ26_02285 [Rhodospirillales bacterium]|nr:hypothetical protein [Rhodospirillales bacterium]MDE2318803.1 hypothetical protein [Rhodospirillales bacterium]